MDNTSDGNPLAEVALALAMGFFSIMVLAMVSMAAQRPEAAETPNAVAAAMLMIVEPDGSQDAMTIDDKAIVIFHRGVYLNPDLTPFDRNESAGKPLVLAVDPETSLTASMTARAGLGGRDITMTVLNQAWINRLKGVEK
jgi:hypothetical protein